MFKNLLYLVLSYFLVLSSTYAQVIISDATTTTNSTEDVWIRGVQNEFNNNIPLTTPQYGNFEVKRMRYGNGFLKIGRGNARTIQNNFHLSSTNFSCTAVGNQDGLITFFNENNEHQWTAQLGLCTSPNTSSNTNIIDVSTDASGNVFVIFSVAGTTNSTGVNLLPPPITILSGSSVIARIHRDVSSSYTHWNSGWSDALFTVPPTASITHYTRTFVARISHTNTTAPEITVRDLNITYPNWANPASRDNNFNNLRIEPDTKGGLGFYVSGSVDRTLDLQIGHLHGGNPNFSLTLPSITDVSIGNVSTFIVRYDDSWQPVWAKRIVTNAVATGASGTQGLQGNQNIDLTVDEQGNPYMQIAHGVGITSNAVRAISADQNTPNPSSSTFENIGTVNSNGIGASIGFSLTRFEMMTGAVNWTTSGTDYRLPPVNSMNSKLAISNGRLYVLGEFGFSTANFSFSFHQTTLSSTSGDNRVLNGESIPSDLTNRNLLLVGYDLDGKVEWARSADGANERAYTIDVDREGNAYALVGYQNGLTMKPFNVASQQAGHALLKISSCGRLFWLENAFTSSAIYPNTSMCFVNRNQLYIGALHSAGSILRPSPSRTNLTSAFGLNGSEYIIRLNDMPIANCSGSGVTLTASNITLSNVINWTNSCGPIGNANQTSFILPSNTEGIYSVNSRIDPLESNELWVSSTPAGADFEIVGVSPVCTNAGYTYSISNVRTGITYQWFLDGNTTAVATGSQYTATWTNATSSTITHTLVVRATDGNCIFERTFIVKVPTSSPEVDASDFNFCPNNPNVPATIQLQVIRPSSVPLSIPLRYSWTPITGLNNPNTQNPTLDLSVITSSTQYVVEVSLLVDGTCIGRGESNINLQNPQVSLDIPTIHEQMCNVDLPIILSGASPAGGVYSGVGVTPIIVSGVVTGYQFNPAGLGGECEVTYTYDENGCDAIATDIILVMGKRNYKIQAFGCINDPSQSPNPNPNDNIGVAIFPSISNGDELTLTISDVNSGFQVPLQGHPQPITSGGYLDFSGIPIGTVITATITSSATGLCSTRNINGHETTANIIVVEAPSKDIYLKDHPLDFGQQSSGERSYNSPSITITLQAPPTAADYSILQNGQNIKYYYSNGTNPTSYNEVQDIVTTHRGQLYANQTSYLYLRIFNRCADFGKGLKVDALVARAVTNWGVGDWTSLIQPVYIPADIEAGGELVIAIPIDHTTLGITGNYHTCTMARISSCGPEVTCIPEDPEFAHHLGMSESNNLTWRNINIISDAQGRSEVTILNDGTTPKMTRVNFDFTENQDPNNAHYLENNDLVISMPETLAQRWQQNNYAKNNLAFVDNDHKVLRMPQHRNSWFEVLLMPGERFRIGLDFDIETVTSNTPPQESVYYFDVTQYNEGELMGGVGYELLIDFIDIPPVAPSNLNAQVLSSSSIKLNWLDNSNNEEVFILERSKSGGAYVHVVNINADVITYTDLGLEPYTLYRYRLKAISNTGLVSGYVYSDPVRTLDALPAAPTNLVATLRSDCRVDLTWVDNASNEYRYEVVRVLNGVSTTVTTNISANSQSYLDYISISEAATYTYKVRVRSATGLYSEYVTFNLVITTPTTTNLITTIVSDGQVNLSWTSNPSFGSYHLEKKVGSTWTTLVTLAGSATGYSDGQVSAGQNYEYRLRGRSGCIFSLPSTKFVSMPVLPAPTNFVGTYNSVTNSISLTWTDNAQSENEYILERIPLGGTSSTFNLGVNTITHTDTNLGTYPSYTYRLYAKTALGVVSTIAQTIVVLPPSQVKISGFIRNYFNSSPVGSVTVELVGSNAVILNQMTTDATGYYEFWVNINSSFTIRPKKNINMMNGVDRQDVAIYRNYAMRGGFPSNISIYLAAAADLNGDCTLDINDFYLIKQAVVSEGQVINFSVPSWQFISSDYNIATQGYCPFDQTRSYINFSSDLSNQNFIGIKSGDVTGDANSLLKVARGANKEVDTDLLILKVVPNPFSERTELFFGSSIPTSATIRVYNTLGVEVYTTNIEVLKGLNSHTLSLKVSAGLYYVSIVGEDINYTSKLVIEK